MRNAFIISVACLAILGLLAGCGDDGWYFYLYSSKGPQGDRFDCEWLDYD